METRSNNPRRNTRETVARGESAASMEPHAARGGRLPPLKHNDASAPPPHSQWGGAGRDLRDGMSGDRSIRDRAMGQGRLRPEQDRTRPSRHQPAWPLAKERGQQELARDKTLTDQGMGRAGDRDLHGGRKQIRSVARERHRGDAPDVHAGRDQVRKVQTALNQQGFNVGDPDGKLGKRTKVALIAFQRQRGFHTTGKVDHATLHALTGGAVPSSQGSNQSGSQGSNQPNPAPGPVPARIQGEPQGVAPATTGQGEAMPRPVTPPQPTDGGTPPAPDGLQMPETGTSGRVPAGSPQEDYKDETPPAGGDQR